MRIFSLCSVAFAGLAACGPEVEVRAAEPGGAFGGLAGEALESLAAAGEAGAAVPRLLGHRWEGQGLVPWPFEGAPRRLGFGPLGRTPSTLLYLGFEGDLVTELARQEPRWGCDAAVPGRVASDGGRFGGGLAVRGARLGLETEAELAPAALTLELWIRPERVERGPILRIPGLLELASEGDGRLRLELPGPRALLFGAAPLAAGRWSHVGVVLDPADLQQSRLVVDGRAVQGGLPQAASLAGLRTLELGGGGLSFALDELRLSARAANTAELVAASAPEARPLERLELFTSAGARTLEVWTGFASETVLDDPQDWSQGELEHVVADADGLRWVPGHWRRVPALEPPLARTCHPTVFVGDGRVLVFSGEVRDSHLPPMRNVADTWLFHVREERWERLAPALAPPGRCHQQAAWSPDHDLVLMSMGWGNGPGDNIQFDDTWVFHVDEQRWEERHPEGPRLPGGSERCVVYHPGLKLFLIFIGNQVSAYDPERNLMRTRRASVVDERGRPTDLQVPLAMTAAYDPSSDGVLLFGGQYWQPEISFSDVTLRYEPERNLFVLLDAPEAPAPRVRPGFALDTRRERFVLFGGVLDQFSQRMDDLWSFDPATRRWTRQEASGTPSRRGGFMHMAYEPELDRFFLLCGRHDPERFLEEAWSLHLDERAPGRARFAFDRGADGAGAWFHAGETPGDAQLSFRFRASRDGLAWGEWSAEPPRGPRYCEVEATFLPGSAGERPVLHALGFR
ncbi:MAG TPA: kelch repeat-containing protein [Planctomycetota bacterium]